MSQEQFEQFLRWMAAIGFLASPIPLLRRKKQGIPLAAALLLFGIVLLMLQQNGSKWVAAICGVASVALLIVDALSRLGARS